MSTRYQKRRIFDMNFKPLSNITTWSDYHRIIKGKKVLLFSTPFATSYEYPDLIWEISAQSAGFASSFTLVWIESSDVSVGRFRVNRLPQNLESKRSEKNYLREIAIKLDVDLILKEYEFPLWEFARMTSSERDELSRSIHSTWMSRNIRTLEMNVISSRDRSLYRFDESEYARGRLAVENLFSEHQYDIALVPNGRFPFQVGLKHGVKEQSAEILHWERSFRRAKKVFLQPFQTQDVDAMNSYFIAIKSQATLAERENWREWSTEWLFEQEHNSNQNPFLIKGIDNGDWSKSYEFRKHQETRRVPIFTSSLDERLSNLSHDLNGWVNQMDAILRTSEALSEEGFIPHVRLHPNLGWKSFRELIESVRFLRKNGVSFQLPWEGPSSYHLLNSAPLVVTWGSTISLESTAKGIPTFNLGRTRFDTLIDVTVIRAPDQPLKIKELCLKPDLEKSLEAIYITRNYGLNLELFNLRPQFQALNNDSSKLTKKFYVLETLRRQLSSTFLGTSPYLVFLVLEKLVGNKIASIAMRFFISILMIGRMRR